MIYWNYRKITARLRGTDGLPFTLGLELGEKVPHFTTFGKNYKRRFESTDLFEQIFQHILEECYKFKLVDPTEVFDDATHVKARANNKKMQRRIAKEEALFYAEMLRKDIDADREVHGKKPLKFNGDEQKEIDEEEIKKLIIE